MENYWVILAFASAVFAGITSILAKIGIKEVNSHLATAVRTIVVAVIAWLFALFLGQTGSLASISTRSYIFLALSGLATGGSWICYFRALQLAEASKVAPIDKSSTIITMILAVLIFPQETFNEVMVIGIVGIAMGTIMMLGLPRKAMAKNVKKEEINNEQLTKETTTVDNTLQQNVINEGETKVKKDYRWLIYAIMSALLASLVSILAKLGMEDVPSQLGTALRTMVVLVLAWGIVLSQVKKISFKIDKKSLLFLILSGLTTGLSWICYYTALKYGKASVVVPIDKLSIVITVIFAWTVLKEKPTMSSVIGLILIVAGTLALVIPA